MSNPRTPGTSIVHHKVTVRLGGMDLKPPVYIAGSFTSPQWVAQEMQVLTSNPEGKETVFTKTFEVLPGVYQYKFRLGDGDWWICDDSSSIVKDEAGNSNNQLIVPQDHDTEALNHIETPSIKPREYSELSNPIPAPVSLPLPILLHDEDFDEEELPSVRHESFLGKWKPDSDVSPIHRRSSTSLGIRISRMGTFLPPEPTEEDLKNSEFTTSASDGKDNLPAGMDMLEKKLIQEKSSQHEEPVEEESSAEVKSFVADSSENKVPGQPQTVPTLDGIFDNNREASNSAPALIHTRTTYFEAPDPVRSYGTLPLVSPSKTAIQLLEQRHMLVPSSKTPKPGQKLVLQPTASNDEVRSTERHRSISIDSAAQSRTEQKPSQQSSQSLTFFAVIAAWLQSLWNWLFGRRSRYENADDHDHDLD